VGAPWRPRGPDDLDEDQRARIRYQVLASLRGRRPTLADRAYDALAVVALPAPHLVRAAITAALVLGVVASATVASAEALPTDPLYGVKLASEQVRLTLAQSAEDRASVELSMAEHRLVEAERLAAAGMAPDAIVASATYGADLANAAAELATVERLDPGSAPIVAQLQQRLSEQQGKAAQVAAELAADPASAPLATLFRTVASFAPPQPSGATVSESIAQHAADVAGQVAAVADEIARSADARPAAAPEDQPGLAAPAVRAAPQVVPAPQFAQRETPGRDVTPARSAPAAVERDAPAPPARDSVAPAVRTPATAQPSEPSHDRPEAPVAVPAVRPEHARVPAVDPQAARDAAERAKQEAEKARHAAEKAKEAAKKTPPPREGREGKDRGR
jgi:uncharacterized protein DUF5667